MPRKPPSGRGRSIFLTSPFIEQAIAVRTPVRDLVRFACHFVGELERLIQLSGIERPAEKDVNAML